jgi:hypothetical protein
MSDLEKDLRVQLIVDQFRDNKLSEDSARRDLQQMGLTETEVRLAMGQIVLKG